VSSATKRKQEKKIHRSIKNSKLPVTLQDGTAPLWMAAQMGHSEVVKVLLLRGADRDADRQVRCSPGGVCCCCCCWELVVPDNADQLAALIFFLVFCQKAKITLNSLWRQDGYDIITIILGYDTRYLQGLSCCCPRKILQGYYESIVMGS